MAPRGALEYGYGKVGGMSADLWHCGKTHISLQNHVFYAVIFKKHSGQFAGVQAFEGRMVAISGKVGLYKGKPQIILSSSSQIELR